jgi:hypothetical protein
MEIDKDLALRNLIKRATKKPFDRQSVKDVISIGYPEPVKVGGKSKKRFRVSIRYVDKDLKQRIKTLFFGRVGDKEYIDDGDEGRRIKTINSLKKMGDIFEGNFYRAHILNGDTTDILKNYTLLLARNRIL